MAKTTPSATRRTPAARTARTTAASELGPKGDPLGGVPTKYHAPIFIGVILLSLIVFFGGVIFSGDLFVSNDFLSWESFRPYLAEVESKGELPMWIPYIFSGMPGFAALLVTGDRWWDLTMKLIYSAEHIFGFVNYPVMRVVMHYFIYGLGMYLLMRSKKAARSTSLFVSLAAMFSTWIIIYIMIGHNTKIMVLMTFPFLFLCLEKLIDRWSLLYAGLLILAMHVAWEAAHMQTAFYGLCAIGIYLVFELIASFVSRDRTGPSTAGVLRAGLLVVVAAGFTYLMGMDRLQAVNEYLPYSTRGAGAIAASSKSQGEAEGHGYDYATQWSFSPEEMVTFVVPAYFGWGKMEITAPETGGQPVREHVYWGQMPFTDAAHYMGISVLILGLFGAWMHRRNRFVQAMTVVGVFGLLLSFGSTLPVLYDLFYNFVPRFSSFRAPSQSLVLLEFAFPILAGFGIESLLAMRRSGDNPAASKSVFYGLVAFGVFALLGLVGTSMIRGSYMESIAESANGRQFPAGYKEAVFNAMQTDWMIVGLIGVATMALMYYYLKGRVSPTLLKMALLGLLVIDLWRVDYRSMETKPKEIIEQTHGATDVDAFLRQDQSLYRVLDLTKAQLPNSPAYQLHEHIMGYHAAKLRSYQDFLDFTDGTQPGDTNGTVPTAKTAWDILNTKYIIYPEPIAEGLKPVHQSQQKQTTVWLNERALPRAWFVNRIERAEPRQILEKIRDGAFDPREIAYVDTLPKEPVAPVGYVASQAAPTDTTLADSVRPPAGAGAGAAGGGSVTITRHEPHHIEMDVTAPGPTSNFLVISEINYPPGWRTTIDGKPATVVRTNSILRGLVIPAGKHKVEMHYALDSINTGKWVSLGLNLIAIGMVIAGGLIERRRPEDADVRHEAPVIAEDDV
jgi:hypothetical protein